jgi:capping protein alpha
MSMGDSEKLEIAKNFLLNSPPGEFNEVVTDVRALLSDDTLLNSVALETFAKYNTEQMVVAKSPSGDHKVLITSFGEVDTKRYIDPRGQQIVTFDHIKGECTGAEPYSPPDATVENYRSTLDKLVADYVEDHFMEGAYAVYGKKENGITLTVCISAQKFNPGNFWNGRWRSFYTVSFKDGASSAELKATYKINIHYYEDGNVQLTTNHEKTVKVTLGNVEASAQAIIKTIEKSEREYQTAIDDNYITMSDTSFKSLRRQLPITRTKIEWSKISGYKLGQELSK